METALTKGEQSRLAELEALIEKSLPEVVAFVDAADELERQGELWKCGLDPETLAIVRDLVRAARK